MIPANFLPKVKTVLVLFLLLVILTISQAQPAFAQATSPSFTCSNNVFDPNCNANQDYQNALNSENGWSWMSSALGVIPLFINRTFVGEQNSSTSPGGTPYAPNSQIGSSTIPKDPGLIGLTGLAIGGIYSNRDISGVQYLASLNPFKQAYAAGSDTLLPVLELWKIFRNLAYIFLVVILIAFGFLIMFRYHIDPRTVITLSESLPRIVIALILITFSYTIAGLFIDVMKVSESLIRNSLSPLQTTLRALAPDEKNIPPNTPRFREGNIRGPLVYPAEFQLLDIFEFTKAFTNLNLGFVTLWGTLNNITGAIGALVFNFLLFTLLVQLLFSLLRYFAAFFILTIFGPLAILWSVLPGQEETIKKWLGQFATATLVFPAVFLMLNIAYFLHLWFSATAAPASGYISSPVFRSGAPDLIRQSASSIGSFVVLGILILTSKLPEAIEDALKAAPSGRVAGAGVDVRGVARKIPFVGGFV